MKTKLFIYIAFGLLLKSCSPAGGNSTGHEYMPDMVHSVAYEANSQQYYSYHQWGGLDDYRKYAIPRLSVKGTIPRGSAGFNPLDSSSVAEYNNMNQGELSNNAMVIRSNGHKNYYYNDTEEDRLRASKEIVTNAIPLTSQALENGKANFNIYCSICHGEKGDGAGYLVRDDGGMYPAQPANLLKDEFIAATEGRFYHAMMYGKNVMSGYSAKLSYIERWEVLHYIRSLQATSKNLKYTATENTFSNSQVVLDSRKALSTVNSTNTVLAKETKSQVVKETPKMIKK